MNLETYTLYTKYLNCNNPLLSAFHQRRKSVRHLLFEAQLWETCFLVTPNPIARRKNWRFVIHADEITMVNWGEQQCSVFSADGFESLVYSNSMVLLIIWISGLVSWSLWREMLHLFTLILWVTYTYVLFEIDFWFDKANELSSSWWARHIGTASMERSENIGQEKSITEYSQIRSSITRRQCKFMLQTKNILNCRTNETKPDSPKSPTR